MKVRLLLACLALLTATVSVAQQIPSDSPPNEAKASDRERQGLRGLVKTCVEENTYPALTLPNRQIPERKSVYTTEFDTAGRFVSIRQRVDASEWVTRYSYDAAGHLLKTQFGISGQPPKETVYSYDGTGRMLSITDSDKPDNPITFRYDDHGRKSRVQVSRPEDYREHAAYAGSPFEALSETPNIPGGGTSTLLYDDQDRAVEVQVRNAQGELVSHAVRSYDSHGQVTEEKQTIDNPDLMIPPEAQKEIAEAGALDAFRSELKKVMDEQFGTFSASYTYDAKGRVTQTRQRIFNEEQSTETTYNEHGDIATAIRRSKPIEGKDQPGGFRPGPLQSETRYSYQYDEHDNWTEETVSHRSIPDGEFQSSSHTRRTLTYY